MPKFNVAVSRRVFANLVIESHDEDGAAIEAARLFRENLLPTSNPAFVWQDHETCEPAGDFNVDHVEAA